MKKYDDAHELTRDYDGSVHPSQVFDRPTDVVNDPDLSLNEKRAILAAWASDACAIEAMPALRKSPNGCVVQFDEIMDALRTLDREFMGKNAIPSPSNKRPRRPVFRHGGSGRNDQGTPLH
jgi:hypothetical protein